MFLTYPGFPWLQLRPRLRYWLRPGVLAGAGAGDGAGEGHPDPAEDAGEQADPRPGAGGRVPDRLHPLQVAGAHSTTIKKTGFLNGKIC